jgi:hypothetical protein
MINSCVFCGSSNVMADVKTSKIDVTHTRFTHYVRCKKCHARGPAIKADALESKDKQKAILAWNRGTGR